MMNVSLVPVQLGAPVEVARTKRALMLVPQMNAIHVLLQVLLREEAWRAQIALIPATINNIMTSTSELAVTVVNTKSKKMAISWTGGYLASSNLQIKCDLFESAPAFILLWASRVSKQRIRTSERTNGLKIFNANIPYLTPMWTPFMWFFSPW